MRAAVDVRALVTVAGPAGAGKSRLLAELSRGSALPVIAARAFRPERAEAWGLVRSLLREALAVDAATADTLPGAVREVLGGLRGTGVTARRRPRGRRRRSRRALLVSGALRLLEAAAGAGALLVVDDLQWAGPEQPGAARVRCSPGCPGWRRCSPSGPTSCLPRVLAELHGARDGAVGVVLGALDEPAIARLVGDPDLVGAVLLATDRTPFAVAELLRELTVRDAIAPGPAGGWTLRTPEAPTLAVELGRAGQRRGVQRRALRPERAARRGCWRSSRCWPGRCPRASSPPRPGWTAAPPSTCSPVWPRPGCCDSASRAGRCARPRRRDGDRRHRARPSEGRLHALLARALEAADADPAEVARHHRKQATEPQQRRRSPARPTGRWRITPPGEAAALATSGLALDPGHAVRADLLAGPRGGRCSGTAIWPRRPVDRRAALAVTGTGPGRSHRLSRLATLTSGARNVRSAAELAELALVEAGDDSRALAFAPRPPRSST